MRQTCYEVDKVGQKSDDLSKEVDHRGQVYSCCRWVGRDAAWWDGSMASPSYQRRSRHFHHAREHLRLLWKTLLHFERYVSSFALVNPTTLGSSLWITYHDIPLDSSSALDPNGPSNRHGIDTMLYNSIHYQGELLQAQPHFFSL